MAEVAKKIQETSLLGNASGPVDFGAYAGKGALHAVDISPPKEPEGKGTLAVMNANNRWLRELGITSATPLDFAKAWETDTHREKNSTHEWRDSYGGRLAIRAFARGIPGSIFFVVGQQYAARKLSDYNPEGPAQNALQHVAKFLDNTMGKGIQQAVTLTVRHIGHKSAAEAAAAGKEAVTFRDTNSWSGYNHDTPKGGKEIMGRSYGHEGLALTFDFGLASLGDYMGRQLAALVDPNAEKKWMKDGHIDVPEAAKTLVKHVWLGTTRAMGEDYAAMLMGYPYIVRMSRNAINKFSPGFKYDSDRWANGGSFKINDEGKIVGNYQLEGMADLTFRFSVYNVMTKMFRDGYDKTADKIKHWWDGDRKFHLPHFEAPTLTGAAEGTVHAVRKATNYVARTAIKMSIIMIPSAGLFGFIRSAQSKDIGFAIHPEKGPVGISHPGEKDFFRPMYSDGAFKAGGKRSEHQNGRPNIYPSGELASFNEFRPNVAKGYETRFDPFGQKVEWHDRITNPVGKLCADTGKAVTEVAKPVVKRLGFKDTAIPTVAKFSQKYADAAIPYTLYFGAKTDILTEMYDTPRTDMAVDRMLGGLAHFKWREFKAGATEVADTITRRAFSDPDREKLAQKKMRNYASQLWESEDEIIAKERQQEREDYLDSMRTRQAEASGGRVFAAENLKRTPLTELVRRKPSDAPAPQASNADGEADSARNTSSVAARQHIKPREESWRQQAMQDFQGVTSSRGYTVN